MVAKLKRLLEVERRNLRAVRAAHAKELQSRTELETLLRRASRTCSTRLQTSGRAAAARWEREVAAGASAPPTASA